MNKLELIWKAGQKVEGGSKDMGFEYLELLGTPFSIS